MGYFDNPKHKAEWEKELSELREMKARLHGSPDTASREKEREYEQPVRNRDFSDEYSAPEREERTVPEREERVAPEREERVASVKARSKEKYRERITFNELLAMENMNTVQKTMAKPREMQRQKEVSHVL